VGESGMGTPNQAFLWTPEDGMVRLKTLVDASGANWTLSIARGINDSGQIIGTGLYYPAGPNSKPLQHSFLLTPVPEPAIAGIAAFSVVAWGLRARRRRGG